MIIDNPNIMLTPDEAELVISGAEAAGDVEMARFMEQKRNALADAAMSAEAEEIMDDTFDNDPDLEGRSNEELDRIVSYRAGKLDEDPDPKLHQIRVPASQELVKSLHKYLKLGLEEDKVLSELALHEPPLKPRERVTPDLVAKYKRRRLHIVPNND